MPPTPSSRAAENLGVSSRKLQAALFAGGAALLWSADAFLRYPASHSFRVHHLVFLEHLVGLILVLPFFWKSARSEMAKIRWTHIAAFMAIAVVGSIFGNALYTRSIQALGPATGSLFQVIQPLGVIALAWFFLRERAALKYFPVAIWILLNSFLIAYPDISLGFDGDESRWNSGVLFGMGAMGAWAVSTVCGKWLLNDFKPLTVVVFRWFTAMFLTGMYSMISESHFPIENLADPSFLIRLVLLSAFPGVLAFYMYYRGLKNLPVSLVTFIEVIYPIIGIFLPIITTHASISAIQVFGAFTIVLSILLLVVFELRLNRN
jgi:drug/metabolite transporter (DMT)-like permease